MSQTQNLAKFHEKKHLGVVMDPKFYEDEVYISKNDDLEFVRSPFYDLSKKEHIGKDKA